MQLVFNKKARFEYDIERTYTAGIILTGQEVKSLRLKHASLTGSYVKIIGDDVVLLNAQINPYAYAITTDYDPKRTRKLLLKKREILELSEWQTNKNRALIPLSIDAKGRYIKLEIGVGRGLKHFDKRKKLKERDQARDVERQLKTRW
jgi:SsrA-binding protein